MTLAMNIGKIRTKRNFDPFVRLNILKTVLGKKIVCNISKEYSQVG